MILDNSVLICEQEQAPLETLALKVIKSGDVLWTGSFDSQLEPLWTHDITQANLPASSLRAL